MKLYVNKSLIFDGQLDKGSEEAPAAQSIPVGLKNEQIEGGENGTNAPSEEGRGAQRMAGAIGDEELSATCSQPGGVAGDVAVSSPGTLFGERMNSPGCIKESLSKLEDDFSSSAAPASVGDERAPAPRPPVECPPLDQERSQTLQLENLPGRKVSEPPGKTPAWLQPSDAGKSRRQGGRKPKPPWLCPEKPPEGTDGLVPEDEDVFREGPAEAGDEGPRREPGRASSRNAISEDRARRVTPNVCKDDFDIFEQPSNRERPASGRRGRKDALSSSHGDGQPASRGKIREQSDWGSSSLQEAADWHQPLTSPSLSFTICKGRGSS